MNIAAPCLVPAQARLQMDSVLGHLRRDVRILSDHGITTIIHVAES